MLIAILASHAPSPGSHKIHERMGGMRGEKKYFLKNIFFRVTEHALTMTDLDLKGFSVGL